MRVIHRPDQHASACRSLATYQRQFFIEYGPISAGAVISIMPMLIVVALLRCHIMKGIATSGLRG